MTYDNKNKCMYCHKELIYDIVEDKYEFCNCQEKQIKIESRIPPAKDQASIADTFETEIERVINKYCGQGMTIGSAIGALQNRIFNLSLNIHLPTIIEVVKRNMQ